MSQVADKPTKNGNKLSKWKLKSESWLDVRPYEWPKLTETERTSMIHTARKAFTTLGIPNGDPAWDHVRMRPASSQSVSSSSSGSIAARTASQNGQADLQTYQSAAHLPRTLLRRNLNPNQKHHQPSREMSAFPRYPKATGRRDMQRIDHRPAVRRPGSGYRLPKTASHDSHSERGDSPAPPPIPRPRPPVDVRRKERDVPSSLPAKPVPSVPPLERKLNGSTSMQSVKKKQESQLVSDIERERPRKDVDRARVRERDRDRVREREQDSDWEMDWETTERQTRDPEKPRNKLDVSSGSLKRKKVPRDADEQEYLPTRTSSIKRQKLDITERGSSSLREESVVRKMPMAQKADVTTSSPRPKPTRVDPSPAPEPRIRREVSPPPPRRYSDLPTKAASSSRPSKQRGSPAPKHLSSNKNHRRRSPIYTTTEDEADEPSPKAGKPVLPTPPKTVRPSHHSSHTSARSLARPLPSDHASLRARYSQCYRRYLITFEKILAQKDKIENMLTKDGSVGSLTDADSDGELMDTEELSKLMAEHRRQHEELASMRQVFAKAESG
ncbi:Peroxisomal biogenesis factor (ClaPEX6) (Peroxin-6) [Salix suchowensis]|nr:Peroxisomal biogenesis factor (ClaPEX6) (Peroxin-6) [Salix suchowensis]